MKLAKVILSGIGIMTLMAIVYLMLPSDVSSKDVAESYNSMSSKDEYFSFLSTTEGKNEFLKDVNNNITVGSEVFLYPAKGLDASVDYTVSINSDAGWSDWRQKIHKGSDMTLLRNGSSTGSNYQTDIVLVSPADGVIKTMAWNNSMGNYAVIKCGNYIFTLMHMREFIIPKGTTDVKKGEIIGYMGSTGDSTYNHIHYEVRLDDTSSARGGTALIPWTLDALDMREWDGTRTRLTDVGGYSEEDLTRMYSTNVQYEFDPSIKLVMLHPPKVSTQCGFIGNPSLQEYQMVPNMANEILTTERDLRSEGNYWLKEGWELYDSKYGNQGN